MMSWHKRKNGNFDIILGLDIIGTVSKNTDNKWIFTEGPIYHSLADKVDIKGPINKALDSMNQ